MSQQFTNVFKGLLVVTGSTLFLFELGIEAKPVNAFSLGDGFTVTSAIASSASSLNNEIVCSEKTAPGQFGSKTFVIESQCILNFNASSLSPLLMTTATAGASGVRTLFGQYRWQGEPGKKYKLDINLSGIWSYNTQATGNSSAIATVMSRNLHRRAYRGKRVAVNYGAGSQSDFRQFNSWEIKNYLFPSNHYWVDFTLGSKVLAKVDTAAAIGNAQAKVSLSFTSRAIITELAKSNSINAFSQEANFLDDPDIEYGPNENPFESIAVEHENAVKNAEKNVLANAVPEPTTILGAVFTVGLLGWRKIKAAKLNSGSMVYKSKS